ncbi:MAG: hypothetical protein HQ562_02370 [Candidatus Marinimicrobia bacterium]|nr:hypothetical protein [Candidatus Neomarinimicrobiota bacterium]
MKKLIIFLILFCVLLTLTACAAGPNDLVNSAGTSTVASFWKGLWHGFISMFTFIISLFKNNVNIYEVHNNGGWYNFGFILGVMCFYGGSKEGHTKARARKKD